MTDKSHIITTIRGWILGAGAFSEENLKKARDEFFAKLGKHWGDLMLDSTEKAFSDHDASPDARASVGRPRTDKADLPTRCGTGNTQEPVAWGLQHDSGDMRVGMYFVAADAYEYADACGDTVVPLYRSPTLTDEEREAIEAAAWACGTCNGFGGVPTRPAVHSGNEIATTLRKLLERLA